MDRKKEPEWRKSSKVEPNTVILHIIECNPQPKMRGYLVATNRGVIYVCIETKYLDEDTGYSIECKEKDDFYYYAGATILAIEELECDLIGLRIKTSKGDIDIWTYDIDKGYYSSSAVIQVLQHEKEWAY